MDYQKLFLQRWKELENEIELEKEDEYAYELFMDEYDDWVDDCKDIAFKAKAVFEEHIKQ